MQTSKFPLWICALTLCGGMMLHAEDTPAQAAARAALNQKMQEVEGAPAPAPETPAVVEPAPATPAPVTPPPAAAAVPAPTETPAPVATPAPATATAAAPAAAPATTEPVVVQPGDTEAQARARAALNEKMAEIGTPAPAPVPTAASATASRVPAATAPGFKPITAPALPINMTKAGKLEWLLSQYKADQITPEQYHKQRTEILAEP